MSNHQVVRCLIITLSDRASAGEYRDESSGIITRWLEDTFTRAGYSTTTGYLLMPDDQRQLRHEIVRHTEFEHKDVIFTTGGTGLGPRDITPETIAPMLHKELPGVMELIRVRFGLENPRAALSRGVAGLIHRTLVFTLPGSPKAVEEYCSVIMPMLIHALEMVNADNSGHTHPSDTSETPTRI